MNKKLYGLTDDYYLVVIEDVCKCIECKKRGMYEAQIYKLYGKEFHNKEFYDSVRLDRLNECLIYVSDDVEKIKRKILKHRFRELINECSKLKERWKEIEDLYFHPRAYTFEELKPGMWVWDDKKKYIYRIFNTHQEDMSIEVEINDRDISYLKVVTLDKFEEGRFYPVTKCWHEEVKPW